MDENKISYYQGTISLMSSDSAGTAKYNNQNQSFNQGIVDITFKGNYNKIYFNTNMSGIFYNCSNLYLDIDNWSNSEKEYYFSYDQVQNMAYSFYNCQKMRGTAKCTDNVYSLSYAYTNCYNLTGTPICGNNVKEMQGTYANCYNLKGSPVCGNNVISMSNCYYGCYNLTGAPIIGPQVSLCDYTYYNCTNLSGQIDMPKRNTFITNMKYTYYNCPNVYGNMTFPYQKSVEEQASSAEGNNFNIINCFYGHNNAYRINIYIKANSIIDNVLYSQIENTSDSNGNCGLLIGSKINWTDMVCGYYYPNSNIYTFNYNNIYASTKNAINNLFDTSKTDENDKTNEIKLVTDKKYIVGGQETLSNQVDSLFESTIKYDSSVTLGANFYDTDLITATTLNISNLFTEERKTKTSLPIPTIAISSFIYGPTTTTITINNFNSSYENQSGVTSAVNVGTYTVTWSLKDPTTTQWADGTTSNKTASWEITKALGSIIIPAYSGTVDKGSSITLEVQSSTGALSVSSADKNIATCSISENTITINGITSGNSTTITINAAETDNYKSTYVTYIITVNYVWKKFACINTASGYSENKELIAKYDDISYGNVKNYDINNGETSISVNNGCVSGTSYKFDSTTGKFIAPTQYLDYEMEINGWNTLICSTTEDSVTYNKEYQYRYLWIGTEDCSLARNTTNYYYQGNVMYSLEVNGELSSGGSIYESTSLNGTETNSIYYASGRISINSYLNETASVSIYKHTNTVTYSQSQDSTQIGSVSSSTLDYPVNGPDNTNTYWYVLQ